MKNTRIQLFNQLIDGDTPDSDKLKLILKNHYRKFYLLYNVFLDLNIVERISTISCNKVNSNIIIFMINFTSKIPKNLDIVNQILDYLSEFDIDIDKEASHLTIKIESTTL